MKYRSEDPELDEAKERSRSEKAVTYKILYADKEPEVRMMKPSMAMLMQKRMCVRFQAVG